MTMFANDIESVRGAPSGLCTVAPTSPPPRRESSRRRRSCFLPSAVVASASSHPCHPSRRSHHPCGHVPAADLPSRSLESATPMMHRHPSHGASLHGPRRPSTGPASAAGEPAMSAIARSPGRARWSGRYGERRWSIARPLPDRNLAMELVRITESAALAAAGWVGRGAKNGADGAAVEAMRTVLSTVPMDGIVVIGEGEKDEAPMLFNGERVGDGTPPLTDVAVDPIDGTTLTSLGRGNALSVIAVSERGTMFDPGPVRLHGEDRRRPRGRRRDRHHRHRHAEPALDRQGQAGERPRPHRRRSSTGPATRS